MLESFLNLSKNLNIDGAMKLNSRVESILFSILSTSGFVNLFSDTYSKSLRSGG